MSQPRFLITHEQLVADDLVLQDEELHHLKVRRIQPGAAVMVSDGAGAERAAVITAIERDRALARYTSAVRETPASCPRLTLGQAVLKGDKLDLVVEKATELGVDSIVLLQSERVIAAVSPARLTRLRRLARSAAKQSQSARVPEISGPIALSALSTATGAAPRVLFWEECETPFHEVVRSLPAPQEVIAIIGPEGGFTAAEVAVATAAGTHVASLGGRILRAETAAIAALALCRYAWAPIGDKVA